MAKKKEESSESVLETLEKKYGMWRPDIKNLTIVSTGSLKLDQAMHIGGTPVGKMIELIGMESSGKSSVCLHQMAEYQKAFPERQVALFDTEHCLSPDSLVYIPSMNKNLRCDELIELDKFTVISKIENNNVIQNAKITKLEKKLITLIKTDNGIELKLTENHKVLTTNGYIRVKDLNIGDCLIKPTNIIVQDVESCNKFNDELYFLLGFYMGDGVNFNSSLTPNFANIDPILIDYISNIINKYDCELKKQGKHNWRISSKSNIDWSIDDQELITLFNSGYTVKELSNHFDLCSDTIKKRLINNGISKDYNFRTHSSSLRNKKREIIISKTINKKIFSPNKIADFLKTFDENFLYHDDISLPKNLNKNQLVQFISGYIMADGWVADCDKRRLAKIMIASTSKRMLRDIESVLLNFNITSRVEKIKEKSSSKYCYRLIISGKRNLEKINSQFNLISYKKDRLIKIVNNFNRSQKVVDYEHLKIKEIIADYSLEDTYDISVDNANFEYRNFLCENVFIHNSFDAQYATSVGVDTNKLLVYYPDDMETMYNMLLALIENDLISCAVIDSQTAAIPKAVKEGEMGDATIGLQARINSKFCMKVKGLLDIHQCTLFFISQIRDKIGAMGGDGTTTTGGHAIKFYSDVRWKMWKTNDKEHESNMTTIDVIKSKVGKPFGQAKVAILWGRGFDKMGEVVDYAIDFGIMKRAGAWYSYQESNVGQGMEKTRLMLEDNPELYEEIRNKVLEKLNE